MKTYPRFYTMCHVSDPIGAVELYQAAFGAVVTEDTRLPNGDPYITISINGASILVRPSNADSKPPQDCCVSFTAVSDCEKAYDALMQGGFGEKHTDWHWTPLSAQVTDKYGVHWLLSVNDNIKGNLAPNIRIVDLPSCRMITSGSGDKETQERFQQLFRKLDEQRKDKFFNRDFMVHVLPPEEGHPAHWWYAIDDWVSEKDADGFEIFQFEGGLFATAITYDWDDNITVKAYYDLMDWIAEHDKFMYDERPDAMSCLMHSDLIQPA